MTAAQLNAVKEQLSQYCDCVEDITDKDVFDMVSIVSLATGWANKNCDTFLLSDRREVIDLPSCMDCPYEFEPYYRPFDPESFTFTLVKIKGIEETSTPVNFAYSVDKKFRIELPKCECACDECGCPAQYKLVVTYKAGYNLLPECLLPVMCNLIEVIHAKNACDCCNDCGCGDKTTYDSDGNITAQTITYKSGDVVSVFLETELGKMLVEQYKNRLAMLSIIRRNRFWGFVV